MICINDGCIVGENGRYWVVGEIMCGKAYNVKKNFKNIYEMRTKL